LVSISIIIQKRYSKSFFIFASGFGALTFYLAGSFSFPADLNKNLLLYQLKVISGLPSWWTFTLLLIFFAISIKILFKTLRISLKRPSKISLNSLEQLTYIALGMSSLTHLFWNYSYIYNIFPILIVVVANLLGTSSSYALRIRSFFPIINVSLLIFLFATIIGALQKYTTFDSPVLKLFVSTRSEAINLDRLLSEFNELEIKSSSQYLCEYTFFRSVDPDSYKRDFIYFENPPQSNFDYLKSLESDVANVVICGESNFFKERDIVTLGWKLQNVWNFDDVPQVQVLVRNGGG